MEICLTPYFDNHGKIRETEGAILKSWFMRLYTDIFLARFGI